MVTEDKKELFLAKLNLYDEAENGLVLNGLEDIEAKCKALISKTPLLESIITHFEPKLKD